MTHRWPRPKHVLLTVWGKWTPRAMATMGVCGGQCLLENRSIALTCRSSDLTSASSHMEVSDAHKMCSIKTQTYNS